MASEKANYTSGAAQEGDLRRRNVPSENTNGTAVKSNQETDDKKLQKVCDGTTIYRKGQALNDLAAEIPISNTDHPG